LKLARAVLVYLLISLLVGLAIGTWIRLKLEAPVRYIGQTSGQTSDQGARRATPDRSAAARRPLDVGHASAQVLDPRQYEEQVG
jgi:hypothetical protein